MSQLYQGNLLPLSIKPLLFKYDTYQTYDLLLTERIGKQYDLIDYPRNFQNLTGLKKVLLFDRYTPDDYPWAEEYSTKLYFFWNPHTGTDWLDYMRDFYYGFSENRFPEPDTPNEFSYEQKLAIEPYWIERPSYHLMERKIVNGWELPARLTVEMPEDKSKFNGAITWLEYADLTDLQTAHKRYRVIDQFTERIDLDCQLVLPCSFVVSGTPELVIYLTDVIDNIHQAYLYKNLDRMLSAITLLTLDLPSNKMHVAKYISFNSGGSTYDMETYGIEYKPSWYNNFAKLIYANNDYWLNGLPQTDLGLKRVYFYESSSTYGGTELRFSQLPDRKQTEFKDYDQINPYAESDYILGRDGNGDRVLGVAYQFLTGLERFSIEYTEGLDYHFITKLRQVRNWEYLQGLEGLVFRCNAVYHWRQRPLMTAELFYLGEVITYDVTGSAIARRELSPGNNEVTECHINPVWYDSLDAGELEPYLGDEQAIQLMLQDKFKRASG